MTEAEQLRMSQEATNKIKAYAMPVVLGLGAVGLTVAVIKAFSTPKPKEAV